MRHQFRPCRPSAAVVPQAGTHIKIFARPAGGAALPRPARNPSTGRPVHGRQLRSLYFPASARCMGADADTSTSVTPPYLQRAVAR